MVFWRVTYWVLDYRAEIPGGNGVRAAAIAVLVVGYIASLVHVFRESVTMRERPIMYTLMVAIVAWPMGYIAWLMV